MCLIRVSPRCSVTSDRQKQSVCRRQPAAGHTDCSIIFQLIHELLHKATTCRSTFTGVGVSVLLSPWMKPDSPSLCWCWQKKRWYYARNNSILKQNAGDTSFVTSNKSSFLLWIIVCCRGLLYFIPLCQTSTVQESNQCSLSITPTSKLYNRLLKLFNH